MLNYIKGDSDLGNEKNCQLNNFAKRGEFSVMYFMFR
jgi:hypothetical protein